MDKLQKMLDLQKNLDEVLGFTSRPIQTKINDNFMSGLHEWCELHNLSHWKKWKKKFNEPTNEETLEEFVDMLHFILQYAILRGYTSDIIYEGYIKKNKINHERKKKGY